MPNHARGSLRAIALSLALSSLECGRDRAAATDVARDTTLIPIVADSAAAVYVAKQFWNEYRSRQAWELHAMRPYEVSRTDTSYVVTLVPQNPRTVGGGAIIEVLRSGRAFIVRILK